MKRFTTNTAEPGQKVCYTQFPLSRHYLNLGFLILTDEYILFE